MKSIQSLVWILTLLVGSTYAQENIVTTEVENANLEFSRIKVVPIKDENSDRAYELFIKLPEEYSENTDKLYPVIYYTDAMWHVEMLSGATEYIMEDAILVGISWQTDLNEAFLLAEGAHVSRYRDYSIKESSNKENQTKYHFGQANKHLAFIRNDVISYIEANYRTDPKNRTYFGYSMGGEFGTYILFSQPDTFHNYILGSPSLRSDDITYLTDLNAHSTNDLNASVFISYGSQEERLGARAEELVSLLRSRNDQSLNLNPVVMEGSHQTAFPMTVVRSVQWLSTK